MSRARPATAYRRSRPLNWVPNVQALQPVQKPWNPLGLYDSVEVQAHLATGGSNCSREPRGSLRARNRLNHSIQNLTKLRVLQLDLGFESPPNCAIVRLNENPSLHSVGRHAKGRLPDDGRSPQASLRPSPRRRRRAARAARLDAPRFYIRRRPTLGQGNARLPPRSGRETARIAQQIFT